MRRAALAKSGVLIESGADDAAIQQAIEVLFLMICKSFDVEQFRVPTHEILMIAFVLGPQKTESRLILLRDIIFNSLVELASGPCGWVCRPQFLNAGPRYTPVMLDIRS